MTKLPVVETRGLSKSYQLPTHTLTVLREISLLVQPREYVSIMGPSGSGKSTLLNLLGCVDTPSTGSYRFVGREVAHLDEDELAGIRGRQIGFIYQSFHLLPRSTALENVALPLMYAGVGRAARLERARAVLASVGLDDRLQHKPNELSGGQRQRVAIARALVNDPRLILADEPTGNLDQASGRQVMEIIDGLNEQWGVTVLLVTHDRELAHRAHRVITLVDGAVVDEYRP